MSEPPVEPPATQYAPPRYGPPAPYAPPQPAYGPPLYGPVAAGEEEAATSSRSRRPLLVAAIGLVVLVSAALVFVLLIDPTLYGGTVLDRAAVARDVAAQFQQREGVAVALTCPAEMTVVAGGSYRCTGTTATGEHVPIRIVVTDTSPATYTWTLR